MENLCLSELAYLMVGGGANIKMGWKTERSDLWLTRNAYTLMWNIENRSADSYFI